MNDDQLHTLEAKILEMRITRLEEQYNKQGDKYDQLLEKLTDSNNLLTHRVVAIETNMDNIDVVLKKLGDDNKLQNKLLTAVAAASIGTLVTIILKSALNM